MSNFTDFELPNWLLINLANVAVGVSLACGVAILVSILFRRLSNPVRHALLVSSLLLSLLCPLLVVLAQRLELTLIRLAVNETAGGLVSAPNGAVHATVESLAPSTPHRERDTLIDLAPTVHQPIHDRAAIDHHGKTQNQAPPDAGQHSLSTPWRMSWSGSASLTAWVWLIGIFVNVLNVSRGALFVCRFGRTCVAVTQERLLNAMRCAEKQVQIQRPVPLQVSAIAPTPLVIGLWRPRIVVPSGIEHELDDDQLVDVFTHELAHLKRRDHWIGVLQRTATICYWWNPLVGWASSLIRDLRERICDDVASDATSEHRYARALVRLAELVAQQPRIPAAIGILSFKKNHLSQRISRLLDVERLRVTSLGLSGWFAVVLTTGAVSCLMAISTVCGPSTVVAADEQKPSPPKVTDGTPAKATGAQAAQAGPPYRLPLQVQGTVTTEDGKPIPQATVTFEFGPSGKQRHAPFKPQRRMQLTTDDKGMYFVNTRDFPGVGETGFDIFIYAEANGFAEANSGMWYSATEAPVAKLPEVKLPEGRTVRGRVQGSAGQVPDRVILHAVASIDHTSLWSHRPVAIGMDGTFAISVPKQVAAELMIVSSNFAPLQIPVPVEANQFENLVLKPGTSLTGRVVGQDRQPIGGCVVVATEESEHHLSAYRAAKTNSRGEYRLGPLSGKFKVHLANSASTSDRIEESELESDNKPPPVAPIHITLSGEPREQQVNIQAGPILTVRGVVRWADGRSAVKCEMSAWSESILLERLVTGADGSYSMQLPRPIDDIAISAIGLLDEQRDFHIAHPVTTAPASQKHMQFLVFDRLEQDLNDADWELRRFQPSPPAKTDAGKGELSRLRQKYDEQLKVCEVAQKAAKTPAEQMQVYKTLDPRNVIGPQLLVLEKKYRGGPTAVEAIEWLIQMACSVGLPDFPVAQARVELVDILLEHYLDHPDLDLFLAQFESGPPVKRGEELLRAALKSPHRNVRAAATYRLASYRWSRAAILDQYQPMFDLLSDDPKIGPAIEELKASLHEYHIQDADKVRAEAEQFAEQVRKDYADLSPPGQDYWTYGELAESLLFEIRHLDNGKIAPAIQGTDAQGNPVHLTKLRGKFVVVSFTYDYAQNFEHLQELAKHFSQEQVAIINVMSSVNLEPADLEEIKKRIKAGEITWPVIVNTNFGPETRRWNIHHFPETYVIDPNGVIRGKGVPSDWLVSLVGRLLAKSK